MNGTNTNNIFKNINQILSLFDLGENQEELVINWNLWKSIRERLKKNKNELDLVQLQKDLNTFIKKFLEIYEFKNITPYLHIVVCHSVEMLKKFNSLSLYSQQGFEAAHKLQKLIWERATSHGGGRYSSIKQTMEHIYRHFLMMLKQDYNVNIGPAK